MKAVRCGFTVFHQDVGLNPACLTSLIARWPCKVWPSLPLSSVLCCTCISYLSPPFKSDHCAFWNIHYLSMMFASDSQPLVWAFLELPLLIKPSCLLRAVFSPWLSRNCWVDCFGIQRLEWWSSSLLKITGKPFLFHIFYWKPSFLQNSCALAMFHLSLLFLSTNDCCSKFPWFFEGFHTWLTALLITNFSHYLGWLQCFLWWFVRHLYYQLPGPLFSMDLLCLSQMKPLSLVWTRHSLKPEIIS